MSLNFFAPMADLTDSFSEIRSTMPCLNWSVLQRKFIAAGSFFDGCIENFFPLPITAVRRFPVGP